LTVKRLRAYHRRVDIDVSAAERRDENRMDRAVVEDYGERISDQGERISRLEVIAEHTTQAIRELRGDVRELRAEFHASLTELRGDLLGLRGESQSLGADFRSESQKLRAEIQSGLTGLRSEFQSEFREVRREAAHNFRVLIGMQVSTLAAILALFARAAHWL
jgi:hypothetical protein